MPGRYAKVVILVVVSGVLVIEGYLLLGYYDRYYGYDTASGNAMTTGETRGQATGPGGPTNPDESTSIAEVIDGNSFVHRAADQNSRGDYTYLSDPDIDGDPNAAILAAPAPDRGDAAYNHNIGVWYEPRARKWAVFNQDRAAVPAGASFEVVVPQASEAFVHRAELVNTVEDSTYLDDPLTNDEPDAVVSVTQNWNPGGGGGVYNDHPVGVRYDEDVNKWAVYNKDGARLPSGAAFNVAVSGDDGAAG